MKPVQAQLVAACEPGELFRWVEDLGRYPQWLDLVRQATPVPSQPGPSPEPETATCWAVVLSAAVGPLRRSKRLTMARTRHQPAAAAGSDTHRVRFERREPDGRAHAAWILEAEVTPHPDGAALTMTLRYDGRWWGPLVEGLLTEQINRARPRLAALASGAATD